MHYDCLHRATGFSPSQLLVNAHGRVCHIGADLRWYACSSGLKSFNEYKNKIARSRFRCRRSVMSSKSRMCKACQRSAAIFVEDGGKPQGHQPNHNVICQGFCHKFNPGRISGRQKPCHVTNKMKTKTTRARMPPWLQWNPRAKSGMVWENGSPGVNDTVPYSIDRNPPGKIQHCVSTPNTYTFDT